jgi:F420-dependent oxidoreductase-like protein
MQVSVGLHRTSIEDWNETSSFVIEAERLGAAVCWSAEAWGHDAATPLAYLAAKTSRIKLGSGIMQISGRTPALTAMTAMSLASMSGDRFILGLGASGPQVVEGWHGQPFGQTVTRLREHIDIVRMACRGERVHYEGKIYQLPRPGGEGKPLRADAQPRNVPIYLATLSPKSLELTGEVADGWLGTSFMPEHADVFFDSIAAGAARAGRKLSDLDLQAGGTVAFGDDLEKLIEPRKPGLAFTLGAMGSREHNFYNAAFQRAGFQEVAQRAQALWIDRKRDEAAAIVPDEMVLQTNLLGTESMVKERIRKYRDAGVTTLRIDPEGRTLAEKIATLGWAMELVAEVNREAPARV